MAYQLLIDKKETFSCNITLEGVDSEDTKPRLIIKSNDYSYVFEGDIKQGKVNIPLGKLNKILEEGASGKMSLEVIAEDTLLMPWKGEYVTKVSKKAIVEMDTKIIEEAEKPKISIGFGDKAVASESEFANILTSNGIGKENLKESVPNVTKLLKEYLSENNLTLQNKRVFIDNVIEKL